MPIAIVVLPRFFGKPVLLAAALILLLPTTQGIMMADLEADPDIRIARVRAVERVRGVEVSCEASALGFTSAFTLTYVGDPLPDRGKADLCSGGGGPPSGGEPGGESELQVCLLALDDDDECDASRGHVKYRSLGCQRESTDGPDYCTRVDTKTWKPTSMGIGGCACPSEGSAASRTDGTVDLITNGGASYCVHYTQGTADNECDKSYGGKMKRIEVGDVADFSHDIHGWFVGYVSKGG